MMWITKNFTLILLLVLPLSVLLNLPGGKSSFVGAVEDVADGEDMLEDEEDGDVTVEDDQPEEEQAVTETEDEGEEEEEPLRASTDASTYIIFTQPAGMQGSVELPAGEVTKVLVGFRNLGKNDFVVETMEAAFRYPQDYSYYIQNFTAVSFDKTVFPNQEASFLYEFQPSESFSARPFGLTINVNYKDIDGNFFQDAVFNETVNITEPDEGLDGETFFLYVFLAAVAVLLLVGAQQLLASLGKKRLSKPKQTVEMGTQNKSDIDYDWLDMDHLKSKSSPGRSPGKMSPRQRRSKRNKDSVEG